MCRSEADQSVWVRSSSPHGPARMPAGAGGATLKRVLARTQKHIDEIMNENESGFDLRRWLIDNRRS